MRITRHAQGDAVWRLELRSSDEDDAALDDSALRDLEEHLEAAAEAPSCRVLVLVGQDGRFCRGMSLTSLSDRGGEGVSAGEGVRRYARCLQRLRAGRQAVVVLVDGPALGGGLGMAAAADILIATEAARFGLPETMVGLVPAMVLPLLAERLPAQKVRRLALGQPALDTAEAARWGLVDLAVDDLAAGEKALFVQLKQLLRLSPRAVAQLRSFSLEAQRSGLEVALAAGAELTAASVEDPEVLEGVRAFVEGEPPPWFARPKRR